jgi:surface antigen
MFKGAVSVVKNWTVLGKLLILLTSTPVLATDISNPRFFDYRSGPTVVADLLNITFGWFKTLDDNQKSAYYQSITHAVMYAENGNKVEWFQGAASGYSLPVMTWPNGSGYCRRIYIQAIAHNTERTMQRTACFDNSNSSWRWIRE